MAKYGIVYRTADFIFRSLDAKPGSSEYIITLIDLIQHLDKVQSENQAVTIVVWAADGIWVTYRGQKLFMVLPRKRGIRILFHRGLEGEIKELHRILVAHSRSGGTIKEKSTNDDYYLWPLGPDEFVLIKSFLENLPRVQHDPADTGHPRNFPGEVRQIALEQFEREGRWCPGTGQIKRHKLGTSDRIEFDHVLPYSKSGASSELNIQVLCTECNRMKWASAL